MTETSCLPRRSQAGLKLGRPRKLSEAQVVEMRRRRWEEGELFKNLASDYGVAEGTANKIVRGEHYSEFKMYPLMPKGHKPHLLGLPKDKIQ